MATTDGYGYESWKAIYNTDYKPGQVIRRGNMHFVREVTPLESAIEVAVQELRGANGI